MSIVIHGPELIGAVNKPTMKRFRKIFNECFPRDPWSQAVPFKSDDVIWATVDGKIAGFCMFHTTPPEKFHTEGFYMYNLGVGKAFREIGVASQMLDLAKKTYQVIHCHHISTDTKGHKWFHKRGFIPQRKWRVKYIEYTWPIQAVSPEYAAREFAKILPSLTAEASPHYDHEENLFYLNV